MHPADPFAQLLSPECSRRAACSTLTRRAPSRHRLCGRRTSFRGRGRGRTWPKGLFSVSLGFLILVGCHRAEEEPQEPEVAQVTVVPRHQGIEAPREDSEYRSTPVAGPVVSPVPEMPEASGLFNPEGAPAPPPPPSAPAPQANVPKPRAKKVPIPVPDPALELEADDSVAVFFDAPPAEEPPGVRARLSKQLEAKARATTPSTGLDSRLQGARKDAERHFLGRQVEERHSQLFALGYVGDLPEADDLVFSIPDPAPVAEPTQEVKNRSESPELARLEARRFLEASRSLEGLRFQPASGYWANTYVPGDPQLRYLGDVLRSTGGLADAAAPAALARRPVRPLDPPRRAALGVSLHADRSAITERSRVLLRVGLRATDRFAGRRPSMNLALVVDLRSPLEAAAAARLRALLTAFAEGREVGDRFRLILCGPDGGLALDAASFRHGPLLDLLQRRLVPGESPEGPVFSPAEAFELASREVASEDDPSAPLGSSAVVLVATAPLGAHLASMEALAHRTAVAGIASSTVGFAAADPQELKRLALAGQGRTYRLDDAEGAATLVDHELQASARAVARAARLRIRLAPGVELVDVVGSRRFDEAGASRVREAEKAIDQRLQRSLGLTADRGEDDEGIQIVIPAFYAGDSHAILLDVVTPGPGAIADVTVRFKDLAHLENGVTRAHLALARGDRPRGAIERSVLESRLAHEMHTGLEKAAALVEKGSRSKAAAEVERLQRLLAGMLLEIPGLEHHRGLERDRRMLTGFRLALKGVPRGGTTPWAAALRYAALRKLLPPPDLLG